MHPGIQEVLTEPGRFDDSSSDRLDFPPLYSGPHRLKAGLLRCASHFQCPDNFFVRFAYEHWPPNGRMITLVTRSDGQQHDFILLNRPKGGPAKDWPRMRTGGDDGINARTLCARSPYCGVRFGRHFTLCHADLNRIHGCLKPGLGNPVSKADNLNLCRGLHGPELAQGVFDVDPFGLRQRLHQRGQYVKSHESAAGQTDPPSRFQPTCRLGQNIFQRIYFRVWVILVWVSKNARRTHIPDLPGQQGIFDAFRAAEHNWISLPGEEDAGRFEMYRKVRQPAGVRWSKYGPVIGVSDDEIERVFLHHVLDLGPAGGIFIARNDRMKRHLNLLSMFDRQPPRHCSVKTGVRQLDGKILISPFKAESMFIQQFVDEGLGNSSYLIACEASGLAAVIDPQRDVDKYLQTAAGLGLKLRYALDTHLHADFISGARELAALLDLEIGASADAQLSFEHVALQEGGSIELGDLSIGVLATPGHTPEHISFTVTEAKRATPPRLFTGGALIVGGAARTDLLGHAHTLPLAQQLYYTIQAKLLKFPDEAIVYPTHGAGSFCNAPVSRERVTTIGQERINNRLALARSEEEFIAEALRGLPAYPRYYRYLRSINQHGAKIFGGVPVVPPLSASEVKAWAEQGGAILDVRPPEIMQRGYIPNAYCITLDAPLIAWAGWLIPFGTPLVLVASEAVELEAVLRVLMRIGYDEVRGYLEGGFESWEQANFPVESMNVIQVERAQEEIRSGSAPLVVDVRHGEEFAAGHIHGARHIENGDLPYIDLDLPQDRLIVLHCARRDRSTAAYSILRRRGYQQLALIDGGFSAWEQAGYDVE